MTDRPGPASIATLEPFLELRDALTAERLDDGGPAVCAALTAALDEGLRALFADVGSEGFSVVAVGGYGRSEMCLHSDVDIMLLHDGRLPQSAVQQMLYPLWDAKFSVGHAVRSVREAVDAAHDRLETLTALLDGRTVAGPGHLLDDLHDALAGRLRRNKLDPVRALADIERDRVEAEAFPLLEADIKEGRGGLRSLQAMWWVHRSAKLAGREAPAVVSDEWARATLLAVRNALHASAGKGENRFRFDLRIDVARWLGTGPEQSAADLQDARRKVDDAASSFWAEAGPRRRSRLRRRHPKSLDASALAVAAAAAQRPTPVLTNDEVEVIRADPGPIWDEADRNSLFGLLRSGRRGWAVFRALDRIGWTDRFLAELSHVRSRPQHVPFHLHTVDGHLWRTVAELGDIISPEAESKEPWAPEVTAELGSHDEVLLAGLLHDVGKGLPGDHSEAGAEVARLLCGRIGLDAEAVGDVVATVRNHLLLSDTATRRDIDDPSVIGRVADQVGDLRRLRMLYLVSIADARATGPAMWTDWKASLVRGVFARVAAELQRREEETGPSVHRQRRLAELEAAAVPELARAEVRAHVRAMPGEYLDAFEPGEILDHLRLLTSPPGPGEVRVESNAAEALPTVTVVAADRPGLLAAVSGVFAVHNVSILGARLFTRTDGTAVDVFQVEDGLGRKIDESVWKDVAVEVAAVMRGEHDLTPHLAAKSRAYDLPATGTIPVRVEVDPSAAASDTVIEVHCLDHVGRLHTIARTLHDVGLDVRIAKIETRGDEVVDTFYVREADGTPLAGEERRDEVRHALEAALTSSR